MKVTLLLLAFGALVLKSFIEWEEKRFKLRISSIPVNREHERNNIYFAILNKEPSKATYRKRKK